MPIYEYRCTSCEREFEYQQRMTEDPKSECEVCGGALERLISRTSFQLKGSGWYKDLYSSAKPDKAKAGGSSGDSGAGGESSGDSGGTSASAPKDASASKDASSTPAAKSDAKPAKASSGD